MNTEAEFRGGLADAGLQSHDIERAVVVAKAFGAAQFDPPIIPTDMSTLERLEMLEAMARSRGLMP